MSKLGRILFRIVSALLWCAALVATLEVWALLRWNHIESTNPFVRSRKEQTPWPVIENEIPALPARVTLPEMREPFRSRGKSATPLPEPDPRREMENRLPFFLAYEDWERYTFANLYRLHVFQLFPEGRLGKCYSSPEYRGENTLKALVGEEDATRILDAWQGMKAANDSVAFVDGNHASARAAFGYCLAFPNPPGDEEWVWLLFSNPSEPSPDADDLWEQPYFKYRRHVTAAKRLNVLGVAEEFYLNNFGFRDADLIVPKPDGVYRILCVGASTTEEGATNELTYPAFLETMLNQRFETNHFCVVNCGVSGMNSLKHRLRAADYLLLEPDRIILYLAVNDICHDLFPLWVRNMSPWQRVLRESRFIRRYANRLLFPGEQEMFDQIWQFKMGDLRYIARHARARGVKVSLCSFAAPNPALLSQEEYDYFDYYTTREWGGRYVSFDTYLRALNAYNAAIRRLCEEEGLDYIPIAEKLQGGSQLFGDICHLRGDHIALKAHYVAEALIPLLARECAASMRESGEDGAIK